MKEYLKNVLNLIFPLLLCQPVLGQVIKEKNLLFTENRESLEKGNIHLAVAFLEKDELLERAKEIEDLDYNGLFEDQGVKYLFSKFQLEVKKPLSFFSRKTLHNPKGFEKLSKDVKVKRFSQKSKTQIDLVAEKKISFFTIRSEASFYYMNEDDYQDNDFVINSLESLIQGRKPYAVTMVSTASFSKYFKKAVNLCFYEDVDRVLMTCFTLMSLGHDVIRKYGWAVDFRQRFRDEVLYTAKQIRKME
ncbi:MAG: hypothetical protein VYD54_13010 [Bdellovibrionota bacterium]|nr:hypothetical protein [Bdellovibrionota bacterium]